MSLTQSKLNVEYLIEAIPDPRMPYAAVGVTQGSSVRVLCRYPAKDPLYLEVETARGELVTLPVWVAEEVRVRPVA